MVVVSPVIQPGSTIGIIGGGQLGRMTALAAANLGYNIHVFSNEPRSPAVPVAHASTINDFTNKEALLAFAKAVHIATFEFENIPIDSIKFLAEHIPLFPKPDSLHIAQHRLREKNFLKQQHIKTAPFKGVFSLQDLEEAVQEIGLPAVLKTAQLGYDGKGQIIIKEEADLKKIWEGFNSTEAILEGFVPYQKELSVIVCRSLEYGHEIYPIMENIHKRGILDTTIAPARIDPALAEKAQAIALQIAQALDIIGVIAIEMFLVEGEILVNEIAPRPHNSGHWTIDAAVTSQFEQLIRAICGLPLGSVVLHSQAKMINLIGEDVTAWKQYLHDPLAKLHLYGKGDIREGRKMGHVTKITPLATLR